jgi:hypothetical protein
MPLLKRARHVSVTGAAAASTCGVWAVNANQHACDSWGVRIATGQPRNARPTNSRRSTPHLRGLGRACCGKRPHQVAEGMGGQLWHAAGRGARH